MRTLLSRLVKNRSVKHRKRICIDQQLNKKIRRHRLNERIGIIAFLCLCGIGVVAVLIAIFGQLLGLGA